MKLFKFLIISIILLCGYGNIASQQVKAELSEYTSQTEKEIKEDAAPGLLSKDDFDYPSEYEAYLNRSHIFGDYQCKILSEMYDIKGIKIEKYKGTDTQISIPSKIKGVKVISIGNNAFENSNLTSITIPETITELEKGAFSGCNAQIVKPSYLKLPNYFFNNESTTMDYMLLKLQLIMLKTVSQLPIT